MAKKEITGFVKLQINGGQANPAPPVGPALGQRGINIMEFCKAFNEKTKAFMGKPVPVIITVYKDKKFDFVIKSPPASHYIRIMQSKRFRKVLSLKSNDQFDFNDVIDKIKSNCTTKFDESIDLSLQINNKQKKSEINIRTAVNMPSGTGKKVKVAVVCEENKIEAAKKAGADIVGSDDLVEKIKNGDIQFEKLISTSSMMIKLSKLGKILGPKGLMPNPKLGTVSDDVETAVKNAKSGQVEIRNDKDGNIGLSIGKKSFPNENLIKNFNAIIETLDKEKNNNNIKGNLIKSSYLTSTMGISYKLKLGKNI